MRTFEVSPVEPPEQPLPGVSLPDALARWHALAPEASGANLAHLVWPNGEPFRMDDQVFWPRGNPFLDALHAAFALHYPLTLSPDDVWLCVAQGFAYHVEVNAEHLRSRFVRHEGKARIEIRRDDFVKGSPDNDWPSAFGQFSDAIAGHIGKKRDLVVASFSTTGPVERAASEIVLMAAMKSYFEYGMSTLCGIPRITLLGTVDDWRSIRRRAEVLSEFDLSEWVTALLPVLDHFVAAADGHADPTFWRSFYKRNSGSGGPYVTGWVNVLFPYLEKKGRHDAGLRPNRYALRWTWEPENDFGGGPTLGSFPAGLSRVPFEWNYLGQVIPMELLGGFTGVSQDPESWALRPVIGWAVREAAG